VPLRIALEPISHRPYPGAASLGGKVDSPVLPPATTIGASLSTMLPKKHPL
jgi:hypothetical protein